MLCVDSDFLASDSQATFLAPTPRDVRSQCRDTICRATLDNLDTWPDPSDRDRKDTTPHPINDTTVHNHDGHVVPFF